MNSDCKVFFTKVPSLMSVDDLKLYFESAGSVRNIHYGKDNKYGFVTFSDAKEAEKAIHDLNNKPPYYLKVDYPKKTEKSHVNNSFNNWDNKVEDTASQNGFNKFNDLNGNTTAPTSNDLKITEVIDYLVKIKDANFIQYLNEAAREYVEKNMSTINPILTSYNILENNVSKLFNGNNTFDKFNEFKPVNKTTRNSNDTLNSLSATDNDNKEDRNYKWSNTSSSSSSRGGHVSSYKLKQSNNNEDKSYGKPKLKLPSNDTLSWDKSKAAPISEIWDDDDNNKSKFVSGVRPVSKEIEEILNELPKSSIELKASWEPLKKSKSVAINKEEETLSIDNIPTPVLTKSPNKIKIASPKKVSKIRSFISKHTIASIGFVELYWKLSEDYIVGSCVIDEYCDSLTSLEDDAAKNADTNFNAKIGDYCFGLRSSGDEWARGKVLDKTAKGYVMALVDYGLKETVQEVRPMSEAMLNIPSFAIKAETLNPDDYINKVFNMRIVEKNENDIYVSLSDENGRDLGETMVLKPFYTDLYFESITF